MSNPQQPWGPGGPQGYGAPNNGQQPQSQGGQQPQQGAWGQPQAPQQPQQGQWGQAAPQAPQQGQWGQPQGQPSQDPSQQQGQWGAPQPQPAQQGQWGQAPQQGQWGQGQQQQQQQGWAPQQPPQQAPAGNNAWAGQPQMQGQQPQQPGFGMPSPQAHAPTPTYSSSGGGGMSFGAIRVIGGVVVALGIAGFFGVKGALSNRQSLVFLHNVQRTPATLTVNGQPINVTVQPAEVHELKVQPGNYVVLSTFPDGHTDTLTFTVPQPEGFFSGFRAVGQLGDPFRYARVTLRYGYGINRPTIFPITTTPQRFVVLPAGVARTDVNTSFPSSVRTRRGQSVTYTHYCPIDDDGTVPCAR